MFSINHYQDHSKAIDYLELKNPDASCYAKVDLILGGSIQELKLGQNTIISAKDMSTYYKTFRSSILFPFANRIENGSFSFNNKNFELDKSDTDKHNAIHGLVYDKTFELIGQDYSSTKASVILSFDEFKPTKGFPFKYNITLEYVLTKNSLELNVQVKNQDQSAFPFSLGWHPYFKTKDLFNSQLNINSSKRILVNDKMIPIGMEQINWNGFRKIEDKVFDDCFVLKTNNLEFRTPEYNLEFTFSSEENYLQLYTPDDRRSIAIEPQTAPANSFNTKMGLQILKPNEVYNLNWKINLK